MNDHHFCTCDNPECKLNPNLQAKESYILALGIIFAKVRTWNGIFQIMEVKDPLRHDYSESTRLILKMRGEIY